MINHRGHREHGVKEFAGGYIKTSEGVVKDRGVGAHLKRHAGAYTGTLIAPVLGTGIGALIDVARKKPNIVKTSEMEPAVSDKTAALLGLRGPVLMSANLKPALRELAARSGRIVEFGDGEADEAVIAALKAAASADETPAQRAMLLKRGLIEMVKGQLVINERGYDMMKKAGMPPKLTPEERREEIMGTEEEKRLSRFDHRGHREHGVEFARGDYAIPVLKNALKRGIGNGGDAISIHEIGVSGTAIPSLRGNAGNVRRALNKFWESPHGMKEATGLMRGTRNWAAQTIREARNA